MFLKGLSLRQLDLLADYMKQMFFQENESIIKEGELGKYNAIKFILIPKTLILILAAIKFQDQRNHFQKSAAETAAAI